MATTSSGKLRRTIGQIRRRITEKLTEEIVSEADLSSFTKEKVYEAVLDLLDYHEQLHIQFQKLQRSHLEWSELEAQDPKETNVKRDYIVKYGDYLPLFQSVPAKLNEITQLYTFGKNRLSKIDPKQAKTLPEADELIDNIIVPTTPKQDTSNVPSLPETSSDATAHQPEQDKKSPSTSTDPIIIGPSPGQTIPISMGHPTSWTTPLSVSLPRMTMPSFNGNIDTYLEFKEQFNSIMNHLNVDDVTKLKYLKTSVSGEAADLLRSLPIIPSNLQVAWKSFEDMYGGEFRIKHSLLLKIRQLPDLSNNKNPADLQNYAIQASMLFEQLHNMHSDVDNLSTCELIQSKLPKRVIHKLYGSGEENCPKTTKQLLQRIKEIARTELLVSEIHHSADRRSHATTMSTMTHHNNRKSGQGNQRGQVTNITGQHQQSGREPVSKPCPFCVEARMLHHPHLCRK